MGDRGTGTLEKLMATLNPQPMRLPATRLCFLAILFAGSGFAFAANLVPRDTDGKPDDTP